MFISFCFRVLIFITQTRHLNMADDNTIIVQPEPTGRNVVKDHCLIDELRSERTAATPDIVDSKPGLGKIAAELHMHIGE